MKLVKLIVSLLVVSIAAYIGQLFTLPAISTWYAALNKPIFSPPNWIFGPVWTLLYLLMAVSAYIVWLRGWENKDARTALMAFGAQLGLNVIWSALFFGLKSPLLAFFEILLLWLLIFWMILRMRKVSSAAGLLQMPYLGWVSFAVILNFAVVILN